MELHKAIYRYSSVEFSEPKQLHYSNPDLREQFPTAKQFNNHNIYKFDTSSSTNLCAINAGRLRPTPHLTRVITRISVKHNRGQVERASSHIIDISLWHYINKTREHRIRVAKSTAFLHKRPKTGWVSKFE